MATPRFTVGAATLLSIIAFSAPAWADYPIVSHRYLADPGSLVHNGRVYLCRRRRPS